LPDACDDKDIVVRVIRTPTHGTWLAAVNTALTSKLHAHIRLPVRGELRDAVSETIAPTRDRVLELSFHPCQLRSFHVK
jgi:hypothetical protein